MTARSTAATAIAEEKPATLSGSNQISITTAIALIAFAVSSYGWFNSSMEKNTDRATIGIVKSVDDISKSVLNHESRIIHSEETEKRMMESVSGMNKQMEEVKNTLSDIRTTVQKVDRGQAVLEERVKGLSRSP